MTGETMVENHYSGKSLMGIKTRAKEESRWPKTNKKREWHAKIAEPWGS